MKRLISYCYFLFCKFFFKFYCPLKVDGQEYLPKTPFILCSNHNSHMDTPVLMLATGLPFKSFGMVAAKDYFFDNRLRKAIVNAIMNLIPIDRKVSRESLSNNIAACKNFVENRGHHLIIYPEGTRSLSGEIQSFKRGPAMIASELAMPLVPVYIDGTYQSLGKGSFFPKLGKIYVRIGPPIFATQDKNKITQLLEDSVKQLKECVQNEANEVVGLG